MALITFLSHATSDLCRFMKSKIVSSSDNSGNTVNVLQIPRKTFVKDVNLEIIQGYTAASSGTVTVGYSDPDGSSANFFFTDTEAASEVVGFKAAITANRGRYFPKGGLLTITLAKGDSAADVKCRIFVDTAVIY